MLTITEWAKLNPTPLQSGVVEIFAAENPVLAALPFQNIAGNAFTYNVESALPGIAFRGFNEAYAESTGIINPVPEIQRGGGGGGGKNVMRLVAMIAVAVIAAYAAPIIAAEIPGAMAAGPMLNGTAGYMTGFGMMAQAVTGVAIPCRGGFVLGALGGRE